MSALYYTHTIHNFNNPIEIMSSLRANQVLFKCTCR